MIKWLPHVDAGLNAIATVLLITGFWLIKNRRERAHKVVMISCFVVSMAFLTCYLIHKFNGGIKFFPDGYPAFVKYSYLTMLFTHVTLAALVPVLASITIYLGLRDRREWHRRLAKWTFPIWLYVSITGVLVYLVLYCFCT